MFYVYDLVDPRNDSVFYVGKGRGSRLKAHERQAKQNKPGRKCDLIRDIWSSGQSVVSRIVKEFESEADAYAFEKARIESIGRDNLTNVMPGGLGGIGGPATKSERRTAVEGIRSLVKFIRLLSKYEDLRFWFLGKWHDLPRETALSIVRAGMKNAVQAIGLSDCISEFRKYNVIIENNG